MTTPLAMPKKSVSVEKKHHEEMDEFFDTVSLMDEARDERLKVEDEKRAEPKKPFVPKPHLTQRPFRNPELDALRSQLRKQESRSAGKKARS